MPRRLRIEYEGAIYHVMSRGNADREMFLENLGEVCAKTGWGLHAYGLMSNHFHLVLETPRRILMSGMVSGMKWLLGS